MSYQVLVGHDGTGSASGGVTEVSMLGAASCEPPPGPGTFDPPVPALVSVVAIAPQDAQSTATPTNHPRPTTRSYAAARHRTSDGYPAEAGAPQFGQAVLPTEKMKIDRQYLHVVRWGAAADDLDASSSGDAAKALASSASNVGHDSR
jgi:hypothetical protein